jgi:putative membrane-bound dehydrogenase-like protein
VKFTGILAVVALACKAFGTELKVSDNDLPRFPPTEPSNAVSKIKVRDGFRVELMASEPLIESPVAMAFDENGRLFVVEMRDYSERRDEMLGRVKLLEDTNGDGRFDKATIYATNLPWPTAIICWNGGVFVGASPDVVFLKDTNGDGKADERRVVFTGFASAAPKLNVQQLLNSFTWGLDNRIHAALGGNPSIVTNLMRPGSKPLELRGRDFSFDPRTFDHRAESGGGQWGISFDDAGHKFTCNNSRHIAVEMFDESVSARNPFYPMPQPDVGIAADGPAAEIFRLSPEEPWRVLRTKWRVAGAISGPVEGGGRASGYFSGASGITIYRGDAFPAEYRGDAFIADSGSNLIHRKKIQRKGLEFIAERPADERNREFLAAVETWFRPVSLANAPDGALWFIDMYREVIEHPWSLPPELKSRIDLNSGNNRGRIYRVVPDNFKAPPLRLQFKDTRDLVTLLNHPNGWTRDTTARLLLERNDPQTASLLREPQKTWWITRLTKLYLLRSLGALGPHDLGPWKVDDEPKVRAHAAKVGAEFLDAWWIAHHRREFGVNDQDIRVRYALALTETNVQSLTNLAARDVENPWMRVALLNGSLPAAGDLFTRFANDAKFLQRTGAVDFVSQLAAIIGAANRPDEIVKVIPELARSTEAMAFAESLGRGLARSKQSLSAPVLNQHTKPLFERARQVVADTKARDAERATAARLLRFTSFEESWLALNTLLNLSVAPSLQIAATESFVSFHDGRGVTNVLMRWHDLAPQTRSRAISLMLARPFDTMVLLDEVENSVVSRNEFSTADMQRMLASREVSVRERAKSVFQPRTAARADVLKEFKPALELSGNASSGRKIFVERCASCHRIGNEGFAVGPDLASVVANGREKLLTSIVDPNAEVASAFLAYTVETKDGDAYYGILTGDNPQTVTVKMASGVVEQIPRAAFTTLRSSDKSMMPEGIEAGMKPQDMADLLEFIVNPKVAK